MGRGIVACSILFACVAARPATTKAQGYDAGQLTPATSSRDNLISVFSGRTLGERGYSVGLGFTWTDRPVVAQDPASLDPGYSPVRGEALTAQSVMHVVGGYGIFPWLELGFDVPVYLDQQSEPLSGLQQPAALSESGGVGDVRFVPRVQLFDLGGPEDPVAFRMAASLDLGLPTGSEERFQGGPFRLTPLAAVEVQFPYAIRLIGNVGYTWREREVEVLGRTIGSEVTASGGIDLPVVQDLGPVESVGLLAEVYHRVSTEALAGPRVSVAGLTIFAGAGGGLNDQTGTPDFRFVTQVAYARSWGQPERAQTDPRPDVQTETLGAASAGQTTDTDGDGYVDAVDGCPMAAEDRDGFEDADGCPDVDDDGDGITDRFDACPREPEDRDGSRDEDGCPDPDNDQDGVVDAQDLCPLDPEDPDGDADDDGCPDLDADFVVDAVVFFESDSSAVPEESFYVLDRLARTLASAPPWVHVWVEGHADDTGSVDHNRQLSRARAQAVLNYLVSHGVSRERLSIAGFGEDFNVRANRSDGGKRTNRRVEFRVAPRSEPSTESTPKLDPSPEPSAAARPSGDRS